jgi:hypothetical protein
MLWYVCACECWGCCRVGGYGVCALLCCSTPVVSQQYQRHGGREACVCHVHLDSDCAPVLCCGVLWFECCIACAACATCRGQHCRCSGVPGMLHTGNCGCMRSSSAISLPELLLLLAVDSGGVHHSRHVCWRSSCTYRHASAPGRVYTSTWHRFGHCNESAQTAALAFLQCSSTAAYERACMHVLG